MTKGTFLNGIFDGSELTGTKLLVIAITFLVLFLYVVFWPKFAARIRERDITEARKHVEILKRIHAEGSLHDPRFHSIAKWYLARIQGCTSRHKVHANYLGLSDQELASIAFTLEHGKASETVRPSAFVNDDGEICMRIDEKTDVFELEEHPTNPTPSLTPPKLSVPPPVPEAARRSQAPSGMHDLIRVAEGMPELVEPSGDEPATDVVAKGGSSKERRRQRRATERAAKARNSSNAKS